METLRASFQFLSTSVNKKCKYKFSFTQFRSELSELLVFRPLPLNLLFLSTNLFPKQDKTKLSFPLGKIQVFPPKISLWLIRAYFLFFSLFTFSQLLNCNIRSKTKPSSVKAYFPPKPVFPGPYSLALQLSFQAFAAMNQDLSAKDFMIKWTGHMFAETGLNINFHDNAWMVDDSAAIKDVDVSIVLPTQFTPHPTKRPLAPNSNDSDLPPTQFKKVGISPSNVQDITPSELFPQSPQASTQPPIIHSKTMCSKPTIYYNAIINGTRQSGLYTDRIEVGFDDSTSEINGTFEELEVRWNSHHLVTYPIEANGITKLSHLLLPTGPMALKLLSQLPQSTVNSAPTTEALKALLSLYYDDQEILLMANYSDDGKSGAWQSDAHVLCDMDFDYLNQTTMDEGLLIILPFKSPEECELFLDKMAFLSVNGRKDKTNRQLQSKVVRTFGDVKSLTNLPHSYIIWHTDSSVLNSLLPLSSAIHSQNAGQSRGLAPPQEKISEEAQETLRKLRGDRPPVTYSVAVSTPPLVTSDISAHTSNLYQINTAFNIRTHILISSVDINLPIGRRLQLLRRSLMSLTFPHPSPLTKVFKSFRWADNPTELSPDTLIERQPHGQRVYHVHVLTSSENFGLATNGSLPSPTTAPHDVKMEPSPNFNYQVPTFHPATYKIPVYPTLPCTAIPASAEPALHSKTTTVLCYVRGFGDNFDSQNMVQPLVLDNILTVTNLTPEHIFILPTTIQSISPRKVDSLNVLVQENVLAVMYNPAELTPAGYLTALQALGLGDTTQTIQLTLRGIPLEYIANPDVILTRPVPLHALEPINAFLAPLKITTCGLNLINLLISSGAIRVADLLHFVVLPRNPHGRYEFSYPRLYFFLKRGAKFQDAVAVGTPEISSLLPPAIKGRNFFKQSNLPGIYAVIQKGGTWSRNKRILTGSPISEIPLASTPSPSVSTATSFSSTSSVQHSQPKETQVTVMATMQQLLQQHTSFSTTQDLILQNSNLMVAIMADLAKSLKAKAPGLQGADSD